MSVTHQKGKKTTTTSDDNDKTDSSCQSNYHAENCIEENILHDANDNVDLRLNLWEKLPSFLINHTNLS